MKKFTSLAFVFLIAMFGMSAVHAVNLESNPPSKAKTKKTKKAVASKVAAVVDEEDPEPDTTGSSIAEYNCELGNKLTVYNNLGDDEHIAMRWKKRIHRLTRVVTTTGAGRFENRPAGLIWITIPTKGMLLDGKRGQQLANECKLPEPVKAGEPTEAAQPKT